MNPRIPKLEALLARINTNAAKPRVMATPAAVVAAPPAAEKHDKEPGTMPSAKNDLEFAATQEMTSPREAEVEAPLESRARLVAAPAVEEEVEELGADDVVELDDRHIVSEPPAPVAPMTMNPPSSAETRDALDVGAAQAAAMAAMAAKPPPPAVEEEEPPPPSSRRPIAEPAETPQEAQIQVQAPHPPHTPPPESGKQVAADALTFDDDFTGVREAAKPVAPPPQPEASIQLQSIRSPQVQAPVADEMEADLAGTSPPPGPLPEMRSPRIESAEAAAPGPMTAEVSRPTRPVAAANVAEMVGTVKPASPKTFGELLDAALSL
jgi:hypothetical protein